MAGNQNHELDEGIVGINVTPLVDITLVLLIIFMVTARIIVSQAVPLDLPKAATGQEIQVVFALELRANGEVAVDQKNVASDDAILPLAREARAKNNDLRVVIRADAAVQHGRVIHVLDLLRQAGVTKIAFGNTPVAPEPGAAPTPGGAPAPAAPAAP